MNETKRAPRYQTQTSAARTVAKRYGIKVNTLKSKEWLTMLNESGGKCHYCGESVGIDKLIPDHVIPLSKGGPNSIDNIVASCRFCNQSKHDKDKPLYYKLANARLAIKRLDGHIELDTQYKRHWWKRLVESLTTECNDTETRL